VTIMLCSHAASAPDRCCHDGCDADSVVAVLDSSLVEHLRCRDHVGDAFVTKLLPDRQT
jgi:hypothetical protein